MTDERAMRFMMRCADRIVRLVGLERATAILVALSVVYRIKLAQFWFDNGEGEVRH